VARVVDDDVWTRRQEDIWDEAAAGSYDTPGTGMFAPEVLGPTVDRLVELAAGGRALELAIGTGRVAVPLHERGVPVAGIELSQPMIAQLRSKVGAEIPVVQGDMATARVDGEFSLAYLVFNTIGNLQTQDEQVECFRNAARHLSPRGCFVVELGVPDLRSLPVGRTATVFAIESGYLGVDVYDVAAQRMASIHVRYDERRGDARVTHGPFRYVWPAELDLMARLAGMELENRWADWAGAPFTHESTTHVSVYRRT
jgi:SAM-dependent methyltransferase